MLQRLKKIASRNLVNIPGWRTDRKIVVFESDDWGMIRMASKKAFNWFLKEGYRVDQCPYNSNDALESNDDLELLFDALASVKDQHGHPAIFTVNNVVANPAFDKIQESGYNRYFYESFINTLQRYPGRDRVMELYQQGITQQLVQPQFHAREHLNVNRWMEELNDGNPILRDAFKHNMFTVHKSGTINGRRDNLDPFGSTNGSRWVDLKEVVHTGLDLFEQIWGFRSLSFIAPCYTWTSETESILAEQGVTFIQGTHIQRVPISDSNREIKRKYHYLGQANSNKQSYLVRNVRFEPTEDKNTNAVHDTLRQIEKAFRYKKPAIISSHRVNYIGSISSKNRNYNLILLKKLLMEIVNRYPEVEFMSSDQLGQLILNGK